MIRYLPIARKLAYLADRRDQLRSSMYGIQFLRLSSLAGLVLIIVLHGLDQSEKRR